MRSPRSLDSARELSRTSRSSTDDRTTASMASPFLTAPSPAFPSPGAFAVPPPPNPLPGLNGHAQSPSAFLTTSPAPTALHPPPTTAHRPSPLPSFNTFLAPTPRATRLPPPPGAAPTASGRTGPSAGLQVEDPGTEARRAVGVLLGAGGEGAEGAEGLLQRVEKDAMCLLEGLENAFVESQPEIGALFCPGRCFCGAFEPVRWLRLPLDVAGKSTYSYSSFYRPYRLPRHPFDPPLPPFPILYRRLRPSLAFTTTLRILRRPSTDTLANACGRSKQAGRRALEGGAAGEGARRGRQGRVDGMMVGRRFAAGLQ